jgi:hypothetical protein
MCHHRHYREREAERFEAPAPPSGPVRVADVDRERVVELLRLHAAAGRLDAVELEARLERAYAKYADELQAALDELPPEPDGRRVESRRPPSFAARASAFPLGVAALIAIAAITGVWWLMWLIWPMAVMLGPRHHHRRYHRSA